MKNRLRKVQFKFLDYVFENMRTIKSKHYPDSKFFKKGDKVILELEKSGTLWVLYSVWSNISDTFSFEYEETQQLIKEWMEEQLKSREVTPGCFVARRNGQREAQLKSGEVTPLQGKSLNFALMEERLKSAEMELVVTMPLKLEVVEGRLKSAEVTPRNAIAPPFRWRKLNSEEVLPQSTDLGANIVAEEKLELLEIEPDCNFNTNIIRVQEEIKSAEVRVHLLAQGWSDRVEEQLKSAEITPDIKGHSGSYWVESRLKLDEITPQRMNYVIIGGEGEELEPDEVTPKSAIPPFRWTNLKSEEVTPKISTSYHLEEKLKEEIKPVKFYETELQFLEEQLKQEILKLSKDEKK
jgi:hypothetical protein